MISYPETFDWRTMIGWKTPCFLIESESSDKLVSSNVLRGWYGFDLISSRFNSTTVSSEAEATTETPVTKDEVKKIEEEVESLIKEQIGEVKEIETIDDFRSSQEDLFNFYKKIAESPILETSVKEAATNAMYDVFCTGRQEVFLNNLSGGKYDSNFIGAAPVQKEMVR